ncbi:MAG TPA: hypothetical protein VGN80_01830 [Devosiaceae bacterium]|jgi:hypothetical protein|nr:hypothetical protein [Devosiaceae bacterium]
MNQPLHTIAAIAVVANLSAILPASSQPIEITVPGGAVEAVPEVPPPTTIQRSRLFDYHLDFDNRFDPGEAARNALPVVVTGPSVDPVRAAVIDRHGLSLTQHQLRCQSLYPSYEPASDTYVGPDGIPRNCVY